MDADDLAVGEELGQGVQGHAIRRVVEGRDEHQAVGDVEVGIARRQALAVEEDRSGHGQRDHAERLTVLVHGRLEPPEVVLERLVVGVVRARLEHGHDRVRVDESGEVVDVAVRVVAVDAPA